MAKVSLTDSVLEFIFDPLELAEFIPIIQLDIPVLQMENIVFLNENYGQVNLSDKIDEKLRTERMYSVTLVPGTTTLPFYVKKGHDTNDDEGDITIKITGNSIDVAISPTDPIRAGFRQTFEVKVNITGNGKQEFFLNFYANDNPEDMFVGKLADIFCGRINLRMFPDVFSNAEVNELVNEITFIKPFADAKSPAEYSGNYCMAAAERGLSKLLKNTDTFYSVDRSHNRLNTVNFSGKGAKNRGSFFNTSGFVQSMFEFNDFTVDHALRKKTKNWADFELNLYNVVSLTPGSKLIDYFRSSISGKNGFHVYYFSVSDDYHTLLLIIDNRQVGSETYKIYDQHGITTSYGHLNTIEAGFARQTSWTFLDFYGGRGFVPDIYGGVKTRIWKIQRKV